MFKTSRAARCALAGRVEPRDYADTAAMLEHYSPAQLIGFARRLDASLEGRDFADAGCRLDRLPDQAFASIGLSQADINSVRDRFALWPRTAEAAESEFNAGAPAERSLWQRHMSYDRDAGQDDSITCGGREAESDEPELGR